MQLTTSNLTVKNSSSNSSHIAASHLSYEAVSICQKIDQFCDLIANESISIRTYSPQSIQHFESLESAKKSQILSQFSTYLELCQNIKREGISLRDNLSVLRSALRQLGYIAPESFYNLLHKDDVIEIYNDNLLQVFRNLAFVELCSYTLLDVISNEWFHLYERHSSVTTSLIESAKYVFEKCNDTIPFDIPAHSMREIFSEEQRVFEIKHKFIAPLFTGANQKTAIIASQKATLLSKNATKQQLVYI